MASTYYSSAFRSGEPKSRKYEVGTWTTTATYEISAALVLNDVIRMVPVPAGAKVKWVWLQVDDLDAGTSLVLDVGDTDATDDTDRYIDDAGIGQAAGVAQLDNPAGFNYEFAADGSIDVLVQVAPETGATSGTLVLTALLSNEDYD